MSSRDHLLGWTHAAQFIADSMPAPVRPCPVRLVPVTERVGVADVDPAKKPAAPKYRCDTCEDSGKCFGPIAVNGGYVEGEIDCPDCDGEAAPAAALGDWIDCSEYMPDLKVGEYEMRRVAGSYCWTPNFGSLLQTVGQKYRNPSYQYRLLPKGGEQ